MSEAKAQHILVTGGNGYIGSHTTLELLRAGMRVTIVDNMCNSKPESFERIRELSGKHADVQMFVADLCEPDSLRAVFKSCYDGGDRFDACIHFGALKSVGESVAKPLKYYKNNLTGTLNLLELMAEFGCKAIVFSSSATVYGTSPSPLSEGSPTGTGITNPYGQTKHMMEQVLRDLQTSDSEWKVTLLRYFNPVGAHPSGRIGEDPKGIPNNLMPYVQQVAVGRRPHLNVFGGDYDTVDGTGVRDYIHVVDLAQGHVSALRWASGQAGGCCDVFNLGTGSGSSVLQVVASMEKACGHAVPYKISPRRAGDLAECYAEPKKAREELHWSAGFSMDDMCADSWRWQSQNPAGFGGSLPRTTDWYRLVRLAMSSKACTVEDSKSTEGPLWKVLSKTLLKLMSISCQDASYEAMVNGAEAVQFAADTAADKWSRGACVNAIDALVAKFGLSEQAVQKLEEQFQKELDKLMAALDGDSSDTAGTAMFELWKKKRVVGARS